MQHAEKRAVIISCSDHYSHRLHVIDTYLKSKGYETNYYTSDFDHNTKKEYRCSVTGCRQFHVRPYEKNLSVSRILSHKEFAKQVFETLEKDVPDVAVALIPPNYLAHYGARFKRRHPDTVLIFEIFDLWPETFPSKKLRSLLSLPFSVWSGLRDNNLRSADCVIPECRLFCRKLGLPEENAVYLTAPRSPETPDGVCLSNEKIDLCYLGAINNIIDIPAITKLTERITHYKPVTVHVIGDGERCEEFLQALKNAGVEVDWHGIVFDEEEKHAIMNRCHFGLNLMKPEVCVGLTMKSVDYFSHGLPILNDIPADTAELVEKESIGINLGEDTAARVAAMTAEDFAKMRENVRRVFDRTFDEPVILKKYDSLLRDLV